jgi:hypothetical protein
MAISQELGFKLDQSVLHTVISLRNAFAHHATDGHATLKVGRTPDADQIHYILHIISNSGRITRKERTAALAEFDDAYARAKEALIALRAAIGASGEAAASSS